jgi:DNA-binding NarL/FixJ family response regulator
MSILSQILSFFDFDLNYYNGLIRSPLGMEQRIYHRDEHQGGQGGHQDRPQTAAIGLFAVVTDLTIPREMRGEAVVQEILSINPDTRIIVSSGYATDAIMANYKAYGFKGRIEKPVRYADLKNVVEQVLKM